MKMMTTTMNEPLGERTYVAGVRKNGSLDRISYKYRGRLSSGPLSGKVPNLCEVVIVKVAKKGLGIGLASFGTVGKFDYGIYVKYIAKGSPAATHGELRLKDVLLSINQQRLDNKSIDDIYKELRNIPPGPVNLLVKRALGDNNKTDTDKMKAKNSAISKQDKLASIMTQGMVNGRMKPRSNSTSKESGRNSADPKETQKKSKFSHIEMTDGKKHVPVTKGSLGIDYGRNSGNDYGSIIRKKNRGRKEPYSSDDSINRPNNLHNVQKNLPDPSVLASILSPVGHDPVPVHVGRGGEKAAKKPQCEGTEIPEGMVTFSISIVKDAKASLGISLVPATGKCVGLFVVRFIFPGTAAATNGNVFCGDCIYSVNGIKLLNMGHPQAIHILKKCTVKCELVVLREKDVNPNKSDSNKSNNTEGSPLKVEMLPGTITEKTTEPSSKELRKKVFKSRSLPEDGIQHENETTDVKHPDSEGSDDEGSKHVEHTIPQVVSVNQRSNQGPFLIEHDNKNKALGIDVMVDEFGWCNITDISPNGSLLNEKRIKIGDILIAVNNQLITGKPVSDVKSIIRNIPKGIVPLVLKIPTVNENTHDNSPEFHHSICSNKKQESDNISMSSSVMSSEEYSLMIPPDNSHGGNLLTKPSLQDKISPPRHDIKPPSVFASSDTKTIHDDISDLVSLPPAPPRPVVPRNLPSLEACQANPIKSEMKTDMDDMSDVISLPPAPPRPVISEHFSPTFQTFKRPRNMKTGISDDMSDLVSLPPAPPRPVVPQNLLPSYESSTGPQNIQNDIDDDTSDMDSLTPSPPQPVIPGNLRDSIDGPDIENMFDDNESDLESMFSCIPAPPPPVKQKIYDNTIVVYSTTPNNPNKSENDEIDDQRDEDKISGSANTSSDPTTEKTVIQNNGSHKDITQNFEAVGETIDYKKRSVMDYLESNCVDLSPGNDNSDGIHIKDTDVDANVSTPPLDIKHIGPPGGMISPPGDITGSPGGPSECSQKDSLAASITSYDSVSVYPEGVVVYNDNNKKKTLFSKLKSKILLPSKGNAKEYKGNSSIPLNTTKEVASPRKNKKKSKQRPMSALEFYDAPTESKDKRKKKRPLSASIFSDDTARSNLKASISNPDLTKLSSQEVDRLFKSRGAESPAPVNRRESTSSNDSAYSEGSNSINGNNPNETAGYSSGTNSLDRRTRKRPSSVAASGVSPPHTPPPPPPSQFNNHEDEVDCIASSSNARISNSLINVGYPEKLLPGLNFSLKEQHSGTKSLSGSSSSVHDGSYAAFGPTIISANVSMDNLDTTYDVIDNKPVLDTTYDVTDKRDSINVTYDVCEDTYNVSGCEQVPIGETVPETGDNIYESLEDIAKTYKIQQLEASNSKSIILDDDDDLRAYDVASPSKAIFNKHIPDLEDKVKAVPQLMTLDVPTSTVQLTSFTQLNEPSLHKGLLSDKDKLDPKLQPFIMTEGVSALLQTWPNNALKPKVCSSVYSDVYSDDGWGSEFSSNVLDYSTTPDPLNYSLEQAKRYSLINSFDNSSNVTNSIEEQAGTGETSLSNSLPIPSKTKGRDFRNFFNRGNKNETQHDEKRFGKKKVVNPSVLPDRGMIFHENQKLNDNTLDSLSEKKEDDLLKTRKNPIPKPPRKKSYDDILKTPYSNEYANLREFNKSNEDTPPQFRPVPPFADDDYDIDKENVAPLSPEEHNKLYASIDYNAKANRRLVFDDGVIEVNTTSQEECMMEENGYLSDGTVYSIPERNNSPTCSPTVGLVSDECDDDVGYVSVVPVNINGSHGSHGDANGCPDKILDVQLMKEEGKCIGMSIIGGADTPLVKNLIKSVDEGSIAGMSRVPIHPGDEIVAVNGTSVLASTHSQLLTIIRESPPSLHLQLRRTPHGNIDLLQQQRTSQIVIIRNEEISTNQNTYNYHTNETGGEVVPLNSNMETAADEKDTESAFLGQNFDFKRRSISSMPSNLRTLADTSGYLGTGCDFNDDSPRHQFDCDILESNVIKVLRIELHKEVGRGLGISVVGGPKHVITDGIKVKRLSPNSIAYMDGRLQKDDHIIAINGDSIKGMTQGEALNVLQSIKHTVVLTVRRELPYNDELSDLNDGDIPKPDFTVNGDFRRSDKSIVSILKKSPSEACIPKLVGKHPDNDVCGERKSRSETKRPNHGGRSQSESREPKRKSSIRSRSRSPGIFSRIFRGSGRSLKGDESPSRKKSDVQSGNQMNIPKIGLNSNQTVVVYFDKTSSTLDFTLSRSGKTYGESSIVMKTIRKGSTLLESVCVGDIVLSVNGVSISELSDSQLKKFLRNLPKGSIPMTIRKT